MKYKKGHIAWNTDKGIVGGYKICNICKQNLPIEKFPRHKRRSGTYRIDYQCKKCKNKKENRYIKQNPWRKTYYNIRGRVRRNPSYNGEKRKIFNFLTFANLKFLWFRDKAYLMKKPSIDRINSNGNYILENCRYIELKDNLRRNKK